MIFRKSYFYSIVYIGLLLLFGSMNHNFKDSYVFEQYYQCVKYENNYINPDTESGLQYFFKNLSNFIAKRKGKINIVHIGDSHIQADFLSQKSRQLFQQTFGNGGRGFLFPFKVAKTNNPVNYNVSFSGYWTNCKAISNEISCPLGLAGISITTKDSNAYLEIDPNLSQSVDYSFNSMKLFYDGFENNFTPVFNASDIEGNFDETEIQTGISKIFFPKEQSNLLIRFKKGYNLQDKYRFEGVSLENNEPGILYHSIGLNGAFTKTYNRCDKFSEQLAVLSPDLVILSLGTNDAYVPESRFCSDCVKDNLRTMIKNIRKNNANVSILLVGPGDFFLKNGVHNGNIQNMQYLLYQIAREQNCAFLDFLSVMGGPQSIKKWTAEGLARADYVHFTKAGYLVQGELLYQAIMDSFEKLYN